jgi:hypothetical protein
MTARKTTLLMSEITTDETTGAAWVGDTAVAAAVIGMRRRIRGRDKRATRVWTIIREVEIGGSPGGSMGGMEVVAGGGQGMGVGAGSNGRQPLSPGRGGAVTTAAARRMASNLLRHLSSMGTHSSNKG